MWPSVQGVGLSCWVLWVSAMGGACPVNFSNPIDKEICYQCALNLKK